MKIAEALSRVAQEAGVTDTQIGASVGVTEATVTAWRKGAKSPRGTHLVKLMQMFPNLPKMVGVSL